MILPLTINPFKRSFRAIRIWRVVFTLISLIWWDGLEWTYIGGYTQEKRQNRSQIRARCLS